MALYRVLAKRESSMRLVRRQDRRLDVFFCRIDVPELSGFPVILTDDDSVSGIFFLLLRDVFVGIIPL